MLTDTDKAEILEHIKSRRDWNADKKNIIEEFIRSELGMKLIGTWWPVEWGDSYRWHTYFDKQGNSVPENPLDTPPDKCVVSIMRQLIVSRVGPYVTAQTYEARPVDHMPHRVGYYGIDVDLKAVEWAKAIGQRFDLKYLNALELRAWKIPVEFTDAAEIFLEYAEPDGFNLLFYE